MKEASHIDEDLEMMEERLKAAELLDQVDYEVNLYDLGGHRVYNITNQVKYITFSSTVIKESRSVGRSVCLQ